MIEQQESSFIVQCDLCSNSDEFEVSEFGECVREMKYAGWVIYAARDPENDLKGWMHLCPSCAEDDPN